MSDQWVDQRGFFRNSSGRYRSGDRSPASIESEKDENAFEAAKGFCFFPSPQDAWATAVRPKLAVLLANANQILTDTDQGCSCDGIAYCVGIEIDHARRLYAQLGKAIAEYDKLRTKMVTNPEATNKRLLDNAGIKVSPSQSLK